MTRDQGRDAARQAVKAQMADRGWNPTDLSRLAKVDVDTITAFIDGPRWPKIGTQGKIERALGWAPGTISAIAASGAVPVARSSRTEIDLIRELAERLPATKRGELLRFAQFLEDDGEKHTGS